MNIKKKFLEDIKQGLQSNNQTILKNNLDNFSYYQLNDKEYYLVCLGFNKIGDFLKSNNLITAKSKLINDLSLRNKFLRLEIFNFFFLNDQKEARIKILLSLECNFDPEVVRIFYLLSKNINDYKFFLIKTKKAIFSNKPDFNECQILISFLEQNQEFEILGFLLAKIYKKNKSNIYILELIAKNYFILKKYRLSKVYYKKLTLLAKNANFFLDMAIVSNYLRETDDCNRYISLCLEMDPYNTKALALSFSVGNTKEDISKSIFSLEDAQKTKSNEVGKAPLYFAIAKIYESQKNYAKSYDCLDVANKLKNQHVTFDIDKIKKEGDFFLNHFKYLETEPVKNTHQLSKTPIFIIGLPRSGTTLVEHILGSHEVVQHFGETSYFFKNFKFLFNVYHLNENDNLLKKNTELDYLNYGKCYLDYFSLKKNKTHFTDKMPFNFFYLGLIKKTLPHAKIIFCSRDYRDVGLSIFKNDFGLDMNFAYNQQNIISYIKVFNAIIAQWKNNLGSNLFEVNYENLIKNPEKHVSTILKFCDLDYDPDCLNFYKKKLSSDTVSTNQVTSNFYDSSVENWKNFYPYDKVFFDSLSEIK